jgi:hypothetical protein
MGCVELVYAALPAWVVVADSDLRTKPVPGARRPAVGWGRPAASDPTSPDAAVVLVGLPFKFMGSAWPAGLASLATGAVLVEVSENKLPESKCTHMNPGRLGICG